jgi:NAD(P)H-quinone oxidoreductase subunit N
MPLITTGKKFISELENNGALALYVPLEGGFEGRYQRRLRAKGYVTLSLNARGLGDPAAYLTGVHGVRPPHLGKKDVRTYFIPPIVNYNLDHLPAKSKGLVVWLIDGMILSQQEIEYLSELPNIDNRVKVVVEVGGDRQVRWTPLRDVLLCAPAS